MKKALSLILALVLLIGIIPSQVYAQETDVNPWDGRTAIFVGDSITYGSGTDKIYYQYLEENLGLEAVSAMGVAGSCISATSDYGQSNQPLINRYQKIPSADLILIFMGTNDYGHETPLGSINDTEDVSFYGALNVLVPALVANHPNSKIVFVTPLHRYGFGTSKILGTPFTYDSLPNGAGATLEDYVEALKTVCSNNGVSVIDLYTECTLDPSNEQVRSNYMPDGLHPNANGHEVIAEIMESHIRNFEPAESKPVELTEMIYGNKFAPGNDQTCRASTRINYYLKAGTIITLKDPDAMQWACTKTTNETSSSNLGYFPDSAWSDKTTALVEKDGWVGFVFKYRDETQTFDLNKPLSDYILIEEPHNHLYTSLITPPTCTKQGYTTNTCECGDSYVIDYVDATGHSYANSICAICGKADPDYWGTWVAFGTSITEDKDYMRPNATNIKGTYIPYLSELMGVDAPDANYSIGGAAFSTHLLMYMYYAKYQKTGLTYNGYTHTAIKNANLITIEGGVNDFVENVPLGKLGDTIPYSKVDPISVNPNSTNNFGGTTEGTFAGCIYAAITELRKIAPNATIVFITDNAGTGSCAATKSNKLGYYLHDYNDMMTAVAESMNCYVIDAGRTAGFEENLKEYLADHIHHSEAGGDAYANAIWEGLCAIANGEEIKHTHVHKYENNTCIFCSDVIGPVITLQPDSVEQEIGKKFAITVKVEGNNLKYQWYYKDASMKNFSLSSNKTSAYAYTMQSYMHNRQVYCVITDAYGNSVQTETATITRPPVELKILNQPQSVQVEIGTKFSIKPSVQGDGLKYQWYVKEAGAKEFKVSSNKTSAYAYTMQSYMHNRQVYCVITDQYGNQITTETATITRPPVELKILNHPQNVQVEIGTKFSIKPSVQGEGLTYQWYYKDAGMKNFALSSNKTSAYAYTMQSYMHNRQVYCVITDQYGNQVVTDVATLTVVK